jgi:hypothetical protein
MTYPAVTNERLTMLQVYRRRDFGTLTVEDTLHINIKHIIPTLFFREITEGPAPRNS